MRIGGAEGSAVTSVEIVERRTKFGGRCKSRHARRATNVTLFSHVKLVPGTWFARDQLLVLVTAPSSMTFLSLFEKERECCLSEALLGL